MITHAKGSISAPLRNASAREGKSSLLVLTGFSPQSGINFLGTENVPTICIHAFELKILT